MPRYDAYDRQNIAHCEYYRSAFSIIALVGKDYAKANLRKCVSAVYQSTHPSDVPAAYYAIGGVFAEQLGLSEDEFMEALKPKLEEYRQCNRCKEIFHESQLIPEEGDEWECSPCNTRENAREAKAVRS